MKLIKLGRDVLERATRNQATILAAGVSFYFFLSMIPALVAGVSIFGLFLKPASLASISEQLTKIMPPEAAKLVQDQLETLAATGTPSLGFGAAIALAIALWGASGGIANLLKAVNFMFETGEQRSFVAGRALALALTLGAGLLLLVVVGALSARQWVPFFLPQGTIETLAIDLVRWAVLLAALAAALTVIFLVAPKDRERGRPFWIGIAFATAACVVTTAGFSFYVGTFGNYHATYGALAGVIVLLLWLWIALWSVLVGACVRAELEDHEHEPARG